MQEDDEGTIKWFFLELFLMLDIYDMQTNEGHPAQALAAAFDSNAGSEDERRYIDDGFPMDDQCIHSSWIELRLILLDWVDDDEIPGPDNETASNDWDEEEHVSINDQDNTDLAILI